MNCDPVHTSHTCNGMFHFCVQKVLRTLKQVAHVHLVQARACEVRACGDKTGCAVCVTKKNRSQLMLCLFVEDVILS